MTGYDARIVEHINTNPLSGRLMWWDSRIG